MELSQRAVEGEREVFNSWRELQGLTVKQFFFFFPMILNLVFQGESVTHTGVAASSGSICRAVICEPRVMMCVSEQRVIAGSAPPHPPSPALGAGATYGTCCSNMW